MPLGSPGKLPPLPEVTYRESPCTNIPPSETPVVPVASSIVEICAEEPKPVEYSTEETVQVEENLQPIVEPEPVETLQEVEFREEVEEEPVVEEIETVEEQQPQQQPKMEVLDEEVVSSVIEVEVKGEPNDVVVEVIEVVEEVHDLKDHHECIELVEEEGLKFSFFSVLHCGFPNYTTFNFCYGHYSVITESIQHPEFVEEQELQTVEDVVQEEPESQVQEQPSDNVVEETTVTEEVSVEETSEQPVEVEVPSQKESSDGEVADAPETETSIEVIPDPVEDVDIKQVIDSLFFIY